MPTADVEEKLKHSSALDHNQGLTVGSQYAIRIKVPSYHKPRFPADAWVSQLDDDVPEGQKSKMNGLSHDADSEVDGPIVPIFPLILSRSAQSLYL